MTLEDVRAAFDAIRAEGASDEDIAKILKRMHQDGIINEDQLGALLYELGFEYTYQA